MSKVGKPRKHGSGYQINWIDADGVRRFKTYAEHKDAMAARNRLCAEAEAIATGAIARPPEPRPFSELCDYWLANKTPNKRSQKDDRSIIEAHLRPQLGNLQIAEVTVQRTDQYQRLRRHLAPKTIHNHLTLLNSMLNLAVELKWIVTHARIRKPKLIEEDYAWLRTIADQRALLEAAQIEAPGVMELYATALYTGLRAGELLGLKWDDVEFERRLITVRRSYDKPTKTGAIRHVPILDPLLPLLREWRLKCGNSWLFPGRTGEPQGSSARVVQEVFQRCMKRAKLSGPTSAYADTRVTFHDLRHTFASHWVMAGRNLNKLRTILGHKNMQMTLRYAHLAPEAFSEDWDALKNAIPGDGEVRSFDNTEQGHDVKRAEVMKHP